MINQLLLVALESDAPSGPLYEIGGLPVHPLVLHIPVVLLPLSALGLIAIFASSRLRERIWWLVLGGVVVGAGGAFLAKESGEQLAAAIGEPERHAELGDQTFIASVALVVVSFAWYFVARMGDRKAAKAAAAAVPAGDGTQASAAPAKGQSTLAMILGVIMVLVAVVNLVLIFLVGHTGAEAVWKGELPQPGQTEASPSASATAALQSYSMADVAAHSSPADCWSVVDGNVYNLTNWEAQHPGGASPIEAMCGKDASSMFRDEHGTQSKPNSKLAGLQIGTLSGGAATEPAAATESASPADSASQTEAAASPSAGGVYTMAEVKAHGTAGDCWSVVDGNVYDLTQWEDKHPGGAKRIVEMCGIDASSEFTDEHGNERKPNNILDSYQIGTLAS